MNDDTPDSKTVLFFYHGTATSLFLPDADDHIQATIRQSKSFYEIDLLQDAMSRIPRDSLVVDVGANIGNHTVFFAQHLDARVVAFEPHPHLYDVLCKNISLNQLEDRVRPLKLGLGAIEHDRGVCVVDARNLGRTMLKRTGDGVAAHVKRLDDIDLDGRVAMLKIDVEGMELEVLRGAESTLTRDRPLLYIEAGNPAFLAEIEHFLLRLDYASMDRFNSTPTYLFAPLEDERARLQTISRKLIELYRDVRTSEDHLASHARHAQSLAAKQEQIRNSQHETQNTVKLLEDHLANALNDLGEDLASASASISQKIDESTRKQTDSLSSAITTSVTKALTAIQKQNTSDRLELRKLRFKNSKYRKKIETLLSSATWRSTTPLRQLGRAISERGVPTPPMSAAEFFAKVEKQAEAMSPPRSLEGAASPDLLRVTSAHRALAPSTEQALPKARLAARVSNETVSRSMRVMAAMATIPERREELRQTVESLLPQVDRLGVFLNGFDEIPPFLDDPKIITARSQDHQDNGDAGKFFWVDDHDGVYFTCDDDIIYCADYVERSMSKLSHYGFQCAIGWHGSLLKEPFSDYYSDDSRRVLSFEYDRPEDVFAHVLGTGTVAFHTDTIRIRHSDFSRPNMADIFFAIAAQEQGVPLVVVEHKKGDLVAIESARESSINKHSKGNASSKKNTRKAQNDLVTSIEHWRTFEFAPLRVLLIGRFDSFKKGGIFKSCHLIASLLRNRGHDVTTIDTQNGLPDLASDFDIAWIYPGDPNRPDYATVDEKIRDLQHAGVPTLVNFSYLSTPERSRWIAAQLRAYNAAGKTPVFAAVFTESVRDDVELSGLHDFLLMVPKTIAIADSIDVPFHRREGICFGDSTKLGNEAIIGGSAKPWIDACRRRLPHVNLYAYKQYSGDTPHPHLQQVPHMPEGFGSWMSARRLFVCLNKHLTFEMVACEAQMVGVPVLYRHMRHSLSEYVGPTGLRVRTPGELGELCAWLYDDANAWAQFSRASRANGAGLTADFHGANLEASLRLALFRAAERARD